MSDPNAYMARKTNPAHAKDHRDGFVRFENDLSFGNELKTNHLKNLGLCLALSEEIY